MKYCSLVLYLEYLASVSLTFTKICQFLWNLVDSVSQTGHTELGETLI